jgi:hypothetical protein
MLSDRGQDEGMDLFTIALRVLRRDPMLTRDHWLFLGVFGLILSSITVLALITGLWGDGEALLQWMGAK